MKYKKIRYFYFCVTIKTFFEIFPLSVTLDRRPYGGILRHHPCDFVLPQVNEISLTVNKSH